MKVNKGKLFFCDFCKEADTAFNIVQNNVNNSNIYCIHEYYKKKGKEYKKPKPTFIIVPNDKERKMSESSVLSLSMSNSEIIN